MKAERGFGCERYGQEHSRRLSSLSFVRSAVSKADRPTVAGLLSMEQSSPQISPTRFYTPRLGMQAMKEIEMKRPVFIPTLQGYQRVLSEEERDFIIAASRRDESAGLTLEELEEKYGLSEPR